MSIVLLVAAGFASGFLLSTWLSMSDLSRATEAIKSWRGIAIFWRERALNEHKHHITETHHEVDAAMQDLKAALDNWDPPECCHCNDGQLMSDTCDDCGERHCDKCDPCDSDHP